MKRTVRIRPIATLPATEPRPRPKPPPGPRPKLGLVCVTIGPEIRYRTITRTRFLLTPESEREARLEAIYRDNIRTLFAAINFCRQNGIQLYRVTSNLFPQVDHPQAKRVLRRVAAEMRGFGDDAARAGVRVVLHPDQWVVLNSESAIIRRQSRAILRDHARIFDMLNLPRSPWAAMTLHGGKGGRADELIRIIGALPEACRSRLVLENDEYAYGADDILAICRRAGVPMVFDAHHHVIRERLDSYEHLSIGRFTRAAATTWPDPGWQIVHISNGQSAFADPRHSELIRAFPSAFQSVPWVEVEAKSKELAIEQLRRRWARRSA